MNTVTKLKENHASLVRNLKQSMYRKICFVSKFVSFWLRTVILKESPDIPFVTTTTIYRNKKKRKRREQFYSFLHYLGTFKKINKALCLLEL